MGRPYSDSTVYKPRSAFLGRLALKKEAAGKVRVFAMVDPWTQWLMYPLHKNLFHVLSKLPMDGTFDQLKPLERVPYGKVPIYSYDLSSATDRLPMFIQESILSYAYSKEFSLHWANLLVGRQYKTPGAKELEQCGIVGKFPHAVSYATGQPMGALSS